jgi:hypothetical protein
LELVAPAYHSAQEVRARVRVRVRVGVSGLAYHSAQEGAISASSALRTW